MVGLRDGRWSLVKHFKASTYKKIGCWLYFHHEGDVKSSFWKSLHFTKLLKYFCPSKKKWLQVYFSCLGPILIKGNHSKLPLQFDWQVRACEYRTKLVPHCVKAKCPGGDWDGASVWGTKRRAKCFHTLDHFLHVHTSEEAWVRELIHEWMIKRNAHLSRWAK